MNTGLRGMTRRRFIQVAGIAGIAMATGTFASGCSSSSANSKSTTSEVNFSDWNAVLDAAKGQTISWYGWGGDAARNNWIESTLAAALKDKYGITLKLVGMNINDILTQLSGEMQAGVGEGNIDFIWINGENFYSTKKNGYLWGPFASYLPNFTSYCDTDASDIAYDFGSPTEGYEAPYGKTQMQFWVDSAVISNPPMNLDEFTAFCQAHAGKVTYPQPGDFTGTAFISCLIAGVIGKESFEQLSKMTDPTTDKVKAIIEPGLEYLRSLNPYLWSKGATFPADSSTVDGMFADGELVFDMGYGAPQTKVNKGTFPTTTKSFVFSTGTVGNTNFMAIPANAPHKAASLVAINEVISPEMQLDQYKNLAMGSVLDLNKLPQDVRSGFESVTLGSAQLPLSDLQNVRVTEAAGPVIPLIEQLWLDEVVGK